MARKRVHPVANGQLSAAITEAQWTLAQTAAAVNRVAAENGTALYYDASTISHWLTGTTPRPEVIPFVVEAFARALVRIAVPADLGWPQAPAPVDPWEGDVADWLTRLGRAELMDRRSVLGSGLYSLAALTLPAAVPGATRRTAVRRGGTADVERLRATTRRLADIDDLYGGGHARSMISAYLSTEVVPLLRGATGNARPELFRAAAELTYLAAWMAVDGGSNGAGQAWYIQAVRLAEEAGDPQMRSTALRSLALQALELGHPAKAVDIAEAAVSRTQHTCPLRTRAWITGMHAEALAADGDAWQAREALRRAERDLDRADSLPESEWTGNYRRESFEHQTGTLLACLGDLAEAETHLAASVNSRRVIERRSRALIGSRLAVVQHRRGHIDHARTTLVNLRTDLHAVTSARVRRSLAELPAALQAVATPAG